MKIDPPPMYRREAWAASILGRSKSENRATGPGPVTTAIVFLIGIAIGLTLFHLLGAEGLLGIRA